MGFTSVDLFDGEALHKMKRGMNTILNIDNTRSITWPLLVGFGQLYWQLLSLSSWVWHLFLGARCLSVSRGVGGGGQICGQLVWREQVCSWWRHCVMQGKAAEQSPPALAPALPTSTSLPPPPPTLAALFNSWNSCRNIFKWCPPKKSSLDLKKMLQH